MRASLHCCTFLHSCEFDGTQWCLGSALRSPHSSLFLLQFKLQSYRENTTLVAPASWGRRREASRWVLIKFMAKGLFEASSWRAWCTWYKSSTTRSSMTRCLIRPRTARRIFPELTSATSIRSWEYSHSSPFAQPQVWAYKRQGSALSSRDALTSDWKPPLSESSIGAVTVGAVDALPWTWSVSWVKGKCTERVPQGKTRCRKKGSGVAVESPPTASRLPKWIENRSLG